MFIIFNEVIKTSKKLEAEYKKKFCKGGEVDKKHAFFVEAAIGDLKRKGKITDKHYSKFGFYEEFAERAAMILCNLRLYCKARLYDLNLMDIAFKAAWENKTKDGNNKVVDAVYTLIENGLGRRDWCDEHYAKSDDTFEFFGNDDAYVRYYIKNTEAFKEIAASNEKVKTINLESWINSIIEGAKDPSKAQDNNAA